MNSDVHACTVYRRGQLPASFAHAVLLVDKPAGWTSFGVVKRVRRLVPERKVGHAGTLDPMATGLLICLVGRATRQMESFMRLPKTYAGVMRLGEETPSYDAETRCRIARPWAHVSHTALIAAFERHTGTIEQQPPMYSAVKVGGERLYRKARRGETVARAARSVVVHDFELTGRKGPDVAFTVRCSKGTYIRSLAHDVGQVLGTGAHLIELRRIRIGPHDVKDAWGVPELTEALS